MTAHELRQIRESKHQSPRSMADAIGVNVNTYYLWERGKPIPRYFQLAIRFLATQDLPKVASRRNSAIDASRNAFAFGARFGRMVVLGKAPTAGKSRHRRLKVQCDCGDIKVMRASSLVGATQCSIYCPLNGTPIPTAEKPAPQPAPRPTPRQTILPTPIPPPPDPDEPDLDAPDIEWRKYNARKAAELQAAADALSDTIAACDDPTPLDEDWEDGL